MGGKIKERMITAYLTWHYGAGMRSAFRIAGNFVAFAIHLFSMKELMASLFAPWRRITEESNAGFLSSAFFMTIWDNLISRFLGAIARSILLAMGLIFLIVVSIGSFMIVVLWLLGPIVPIAFIALGVIYLIPPL